MFIVVGNMLSKRFASMLPALRV